MFMGGRRVSSLLVLFALIGIVHAVVYFPNHPVSDAIYFTTTLTVTGPTSTISTNTSMVDYIICAYYDFTYGGVSYPVPIATITFYLNGGGHSGNLFFPDHVCYSGLVGLGTHTWYVTASAPSYEPQTSPTQTFIVEPYPTTLTATGPTSTTYTNTLVDYIICAYYDYTYQGVSYVVPGSTETFYIDGVGNSGNLIFPDHVCHSGLVGLGTHTWYVTASAPSYETQRSPAQTFSVKPATTLTQYASPSPPASNGTSVTFSASYTDANGPITGAAVFLYLDGTLQNTAYANGYYTYPTSSLSAGTHTWYFTAEKTGYQPQTGSTQYYTITTITSSDGGGGGGGGGSGRRPLMC
jgi:hypothetical protein